MRQQTNNRFGHIILLIGWTLLLGLFFAQTEIQIEGSHGWAATLPTWRIEQHPLLDIFWGGRAMTGYHAWLFPFMLLVFHLPLVVTGSFSWRLEARCLGAVMYFWISEDLLWFVLNPAFGLQRFSAEYIPWHKHWMLCMPTDYLTFFILGSLLLWWSYRHSR